MSIVLSAFLSTLHVILSSTVRSPSVFTRPARARCPLVPCAAGASAHLLYLSQSGTIISNTWSSIDARRSSGMPPRLPWSLLTTSAITRALPSHSPGTPWSTTHSKVVIVRSSLLSHIACPRSIVRCPAQCRSVPALLLQIQDGPRLHRYRARMDLGRWIRRLAPTTLPQLPQPTENACRPAIHRRRHRSASAHLFVTRSCDLSSFQVAL
ncbi:hypothetical protein C8Q74DRAFT_468754 [Fomes fomentarius]|nr:hypothetical protein C8Q74DRAFT_468754 [Fomes fomentarius]